MAMLNIEYRHSKNVEKEQNIRRSNAMMVRYLEGIVKEMKDAKISAEFIDSVQLDGENALLINGTDVSKILDGLKIMFPEGDDHCDLGDTSKVMLTERPVTDWNKAYVEDIPDILMKNAISKVYADMRADK